MKRHSATIVAFLLASAWTGSAASEPIYISFHWHMHQPIYWPYETVLETNARGAYGFDVVEVHTTRSGPYTSWPSDAVRTGMDAGLEHLGAQVSLSGSLMENLDNLAGSGILSGWSDPWQSSRSWSTSLGNPRLDLVRFGYHHPLMALVQPRDIVLQLEMHALSLERHFGDSVSNGLFPPETAFASWMIPALVEAGIEWVIVDNIHFDRARTDYPYTPSSNLVPPNPADQRNSGSDVEWIQLNDIWAPSRVSTPWGYQPHWVEYVDPDTGEASRIIVVPAARYEGNEDGRGGFGALQYDNVMSQYEHRNIDPDHPMLVVLHHDGDNYGGGADYYYGSNFSNYVDWLQSNSSRFVSTTIQDYLDMYPPDADDVIYVEPGSWSGADNGDPEFHKWNGDPDDSGYSPDRVSWAVMTAAHNRVATAESLQPVSSVAAIVDNSGNDTDEAYHYYLNAQTSCYWYWDGSEGGIWDSHPTRACNMATAAADRVIGGTSSDSVPPSIYPPQREPYNPGGIEWGTTPQPSDFTVWTFAYDVTGLVRVSLRYRVDGDGSVDYENHLRDGDWESIEMTESTFSPRTDPTPTYLAPLFEGTIAGVSDALVDYYIEAEDTLGNVGRSPIMHVYVGEPVDPIDPDPEGVHWSPVNPCREDEIVVYSPDLGNLHWGVNGWNAPAEEYWPSDTVPWETGELAVESPLGAEDADGFYPITLGPFDGTQPVDVIDFVIHRADGTWDNNDSADYHIPVDELCHEPDPGLDEVAEPVEDAGSPDADAGAPDADAGTSDAGVDLDDEVLDGSAEPVADAGDVGLEINPGGEGSDDEGCGCAVTRGWGSMCGSLLLLGLVLLRRRRGWH